MTFDIIFQVALNALRSLELEHCCKRSVLFFFPSFAKLLLKLQKFCNRLDYNFSELSKKLSIWWKGHDFLVSSDLSLKTNKVLTLKIARVFRIISFQASICSLRRRLKMKFGRYLAKENCSNQIHFQIIHWLWL